MDGRLVVGGALILGSLAIIPIQTAITGDDPRTSDPGDRTRVYHLDKGNCFDGGTTFERDAEVTVLDCDEPHDSEVVRIESFHTYGSEGADAEAEAEDEARDECSDEMAEYVDALPAGTAVETRLYRNGGRTSMRDGGADDTRWTVACVAWSPDGPLGD